MKTPARYSISFVLALLVEVLFLFIVNDLYAPETETEIKGIIQISLIKERREIVHVKGESSKGKAVKEVKPELKSERPKKSLPEKEEKRIKGGIKSLEGNLPASYVEEVKRAISENIFYPLEAIRKREEGFVKVKFQVKRDGTVVYCKPVVKRFTYLESAACLAIKRTKFPPIPVNVKNEKLTFIVEIEYNLEKAL